MKFLPLVLFILIAGANSCLNSGRNDPSATAAPSITDSSGVTIVTNPVAQWTDETRWRISDTPVLAIGSLDGHSGELFKRIGGALRLPDGRIVAADETEVRVFDATGKFLFRHGREGQGPGEYEYIRAIMECHPHQFDVYDLSWKQSSYSPDGSFLETANVLPNGLRPYQLRCTKTGDFVATLWPSQVMTKPIGLFDTDAPLLVSRGGQSADTLMILPGDQRLGHEHGSGPHPFGSRLALETVEDGFVVSTGAAYEYRYYDLDGRLRRVVRMPGRDRSIGQADIDAYARQEAEELPPEQFNENFERYRTIEMTKRFPAYSEVKVDAHDNVWLRHHVRPRDSAQQWDICDPNGVFHGTVELEKDVEITQIGDDFVLGTRTNDDGVPQIVMFELERGT